jgi:purine-nucleoside phosphorylase
VNQKFGRSGEPGMAKEKSGLYQKVEHTAREIRAQFTEDPRVCVVLGSGLAGLESRIDDAVTIPYSQLTGFMESTVRGHDGKLVLGRIGLIPVMVMVGRFHYYEGYSMEEVTYPIRVLGQLGCKVLVLTNAAGAINVAFDKGSLMVVSDHINLMGVSPLCGENDERFGPRFPDMSEVYDSNFQNIAIEEGRSLGIELRRGIYAAMSGPAYETPAEIHMLRVFGADVVGMSTVPEAIVARHMGIKVLTISCVTNKAPGLDDQPVTHADVLKTGKEVSAQLTSLLERTIPRLVQKL